MRISASTTRNPTRPSTACTPWWPAKGSRGSSAGDNRGLTTELDSLFRDAMSSLASGVAVITAKRDDNRPCGLAATSVSSFSAEPPSLVVSVAHSSRCHGALVGCERFGVHLLRADEEAVARVFAGKGDDKFAGLDWRWDDDVPELGGTIAYLRCGHSATFEHHDHSLLIGDLEGGRVAAGEPLLYARRRMDWRLES